MLFSLARLPRRPVAQKNGPFDAFTCVPTVFVGAIFPVDKSALESSFLRTTCRVSTRTRERRPIGSTLKAGRISMGCWCIRPAPPFHLADQRFGELVRIGPRLSLRQVPNRNLSATIARLRGLRSTPAPPPSARFSASAKTRPPCRVPSGPSDMCRSSPLRLTLGARASSRQCQPNMNNCAPQICRAKTQRASSERGWRVSSVRRHDTRYCAGLFELVRAAAYRIPCNDRLSSSCSAAGPRLGAGVGPAWPYRDDDHRAADRFERPAGVRRVASNPCRLRRPFCRSAKPAS